MGALDGKAVIVTGAGQGLGRAYALDAARAGASVVVNDINGRAEEVAGEITTAGGRAVTSDHSVADWDGAQQIVETARSQFGRLDGLVNNAGVVMQCDPLEIDEARTRLVVETNLLGSIFVGTHAMRVMAEQGSGSIVNITSSAQIGMSLHGVYGASKGAVSSLTYSWSMDLAARNIRVNAFSPLAMTPMAMSSLADPGQIPSPEENAGVVTYLLSDLSIGVTGQVVSRRRDHLVVMTHPSPMQQVVECAPWTVEAVAESFDPVLRANLQPVGVSVARP